MYCQSCLKILLEKLNSNDIIVLEKLYTENSTIPQCSLSFDSIRDKIICDNQISQHNVYTSLKRLNEFGFIETQRWTRKNKYYITKDGINILNMIQGNIK